MLHDRDDALFCDFVIKRQFLRFLKAFFSASEFHSFVNLINCCRYFILKENGDFIGYKKEPSTAEELSKVLNNFTVKNCEIILTDRPKRFTFIIRGLHLTTVVERTFQADSEDDRYVHIYS